MNNKLMLHKLMLICIKYIPCLLTSLYILYNILKALGIDIVILSFLSYVSLLPMIFMLLTSFTFQFCIYHRLPIYYMMGEDIFSYFMYTNAISVSTGWFILIQLILLGITVISAAYLKNKYNEHIKVSKR